MTMSLDMLREGFTLYLAASILLSCLSAWAFVMAVRVGRPPRDPHP